MHRFIIKMNINNIIDDYIWNHLFNIFNINYSDKINLSNDIFDIYYNDHNLYVFHNDIYHIKSS